MKYCHNFLTSFALLTLAFFAAANVGAQGVKPPVPREDRLLNGMKVLVWNEPTAEKITIKLRIHSGAAFDPKGKTGVMAMLSDSLFATEQSRSFFTEDVEGSLEVISNYDFIQINVTGKASEVLPILEVISNAVINTQITKENVVALREARLTKLAKIESDPMYLADMAVARQLFGDFPYGASHHGTSKTLANIDFADLLFAKERFLTSDNATLAIIGPVRPEYAFRVTRQLFGGWNKSDKRVPATFRQPDAPSAKIQVLPGDSGDTFEFRIAARGVSRNDKDYFAAQIQNRRLNDYFASSGKTGSGAIKSRLDSYLLPGVVILQGRLPVGEAAKLVGGAGLIPGSQSPDQTVLPDAEIAKAEFLNEFTTKTRTAAGYAELLLDTDTYKLSAIDVQIKQIQAVTADSLQQIHQKLWNFDFSTPRDNSSPPNATVKGNPAARLIFTNDNDLKSRVQIYNLSFDPIKPVTQTTPKSPVKP